MARILTVGFVCLVLFACKPPNNPPTIEGGISGPQTGKTESTYVFSIVIDDPDYDSVTFRFDWGDGDTSVWGELGPRGLPVYSMPHLWQAAGSFSVRARAMDIHDAKSAWTEPHVIAISALLGLMRVPTQVVQRQE